MKPRKKADVSAYTNELNAYAKDVIIGTWEGPFDERPSADGIYRICTFTEDGTYTFTDGAENEAGTYVVTNNPNNNNYHSTLQLTLKDGERTMRFSFIAADPIKMLTDDQTDLKG